MCNYPWIIEINKDNSILAILDIDMKEDEEIFINQSNDPRFVEQPDIIVRIVTYNHVESIFTKIKNWFEYDIFKNTKSEQYEDIAVKVYGFYDDVLQKEHKIYKIPVKGINRFDAEMILSKMIKDFNTDSNIFKD